MERMIKLKKLKYKEDIIEYTIIFNKALGYSNVPWEYHASGDVYVLIVNGKIQAGFVLVPGYFNLRAILQMPIIERKRFHLNNPYIAKNLCDLCGYFINTTNFWHGFIFTFYMVLVSIFYKQKYFIYTYPVKETGLEKYYGKGNPIRIYTGVPEYLPGHSDHMEPEHVEVLTKCGICKIFWYRTKGAFRARRLLKKGKKSKLL
jgi:hypothetical protein